ncbi:MAG TPA: ATP-binding protein [Rhodopila sp.]|nr:ATP-binding protein [Rhodopila sp.]
MRVPSVVRTWMAPTAAVTLLWVAVFFYLANDRANQLAAGRVTTANLAQALEESLVRTVREIDQTLLYVRALRAHDGAVDLKSWVEGVDPENRLAAQLSTTGRDGIVTMTNLRPPTQRVDLSDRPHFRHFADHPDDHLYISVPVLGRVSHVWTIQFVRMLKTPTGDFDGIIVLSVPPDHLVRFYKAINIGKYGRISVIGTDGVIRARAGNGLKVGGQATGPVLALAASQNSGHFRWTDPEDRIIRIGSFRRVVGTNLIVSLSMAEAEITAKSDRAAPGYLFIGGVLTLVIIAFSLAANWERGRADGARRLTNLALEHVGVGIMVISSAGLINMINERARRMLALPDSLAAGTPYLDLVAWQSGRGELSPINVDPVALPAMLGARPWRDVPERFRRVLPDQRVIETRTEALRDGTIVQSFADITAEEEAQRSLTEARDAAEAAVRARAQFLAAMSHEIRTPLNGILGVNELLRGTSMTAEQAEYAVIIQQAGEHLLEMLSEILDYTKIDNQGVELERIAFNPTALVQQVAALLRPRAVAQDLTLALEIADDVPAQVIGDPHRIRQVLFNLIGNAIKFTPVGQVSVKLRAQFIPPGMWQLHFTVSDTGIGIDEQALGRLFQEFTQSDGSITRRFGGTGLGLAICRRLVDAMGGGISVDSVKGQGSTFRFDVRVEAASVEPMAGVVPEAELCDPAGLVERRAPVVLVAEDSAVNRLVASRMLERLGCTVRLAENGLQALEAVRAGGVDLVLMDIMMPELDGLAATRAIRALPGEAGKVPVVGLSANAFRSDEDAGRAAGMNGFATKPIDRRRLATEISTALNLRAEPEPAPVPRLPVLQELLDMLGAETAAAVIEAFGRDAPITLQHLQEQAAAGNIAGVAQNAHALAGSAGTLGLAEIRDISRQMERDARGTGTIPDAAALALLETMLRDGITGLEMALTAAVPVAAA